jgi:hypothetical protein
MWSRTLAFSRSSERVVIRIFYGRFSSHKRGILRQWQYNWYLLGAVLHTAFLTCKNSNRSPIALQIIMIFLNRHYTTR